MVILMLVGGFALLLVGGEVLVRGASRLAVAAGVTPLVVGLTVVAYGTSLPELAVSVQSSWAGKADIAVGNVVGSNIANVLLVLGIAALVTPLPVSRVFVWRGLVLMIGVSVLFWLLALDGRIGPIDGGLLFAGSIAYTYYTVRHSRAHTRRQRAEREALGEAGDLPQTPKSIFLELGLVAVGLVLLVVGADLLVNAAVQIAASFGISELVIGLTIVAVGTSLPEIATTLVAGARDQRDLAVGNAIGSNLFNILMVIGLSGLISPGGILISPEVLTFSFPIMLGVAVVCLPVFWAGYCIDRSDGALFLVSYAVYTAYLYLDSIAHEGISSFADWTLYGLLPVSLAWLAWKLFRAHRRASLTAS